MSAIITMSFLGFWPLAIGLFPSKKSVIVAPRNNTYYQSKCLLSWVLGGNFLASEVHDLVKKLRGREDRRERGCYFPGIDPLLLLLYCRKIESDQKKNCIQIIRIIHESLHDSWISFQTSFFWFGFGKLWTYNTLWVWRIHRVKKKLEGKFKWKHLDRPCINVKTPKWNYFI